MVRGKRARRRMAGVTLIEVMVVMVIMTTIAAAAGFAVMRARGVAMVKNTGIRARTIQSAAMAYVMETPGSCPDVDDLGDFLDPTTDPRDAWGRAFEIECDERTIHVRSAGEDGTPGTDDDLGF